MTPEKTSKAFDDCAAMIQEKQRSQRLCTVGEKVKLRASTKVFVGPTRVVAGWVVGTEVQEGTNLLIVHIKPEIQHAPDAHAIRCKVTDLVLEDEAGIEATRAPAEEPGEDSRAMLRHALWMCGEGKLLALQGRTEKAMRWLGFVQGVMWATLHVSIDEMKHINMPEESAVGSGE
jgi:hypothetical protein